MSDVRGGMATTKNRRRLHSKVRDVDRSLKHVAAAIARVGLSETLQRKLKRLESERAGLERNLGDIETAPLTDGLPDLMPKLEQRWRDVVDGMAGLGCRPNATLETIESARNRLRDLIGDVTLLPSKDQTHLVAQVGLKARGLLDVEQSFAVYKSQEIGSGGPLQ